MDEALQEAIRRGDREAVERLVEASSQAAGAATEAGITAPILALYHGHEELAGDLAEGRELSAWEAAALGRSELLRRLLEEEPDRADERSPDGFPLLCLAAFFGRLQVLKLLIAAGADPNAAAENPSRVRPLHSAAAHRDPETSSAMMLALLEAGADPNRGQQGGWTPLHAAAVHGRREAAALLLAHGADPEARSDDGLSPAAMARKEGHSEIVDLLGG